jgi:hypothetical protein
MKKKVRGPSVKAEAPVVRVEMERAKSLKFL